MKREYRIRTIYWADVPATCKGISPVSIRNFVAFLRKEQIFYYARGHDSFSVNEAYRLAEKAGFTKLLVEDLQ